MGQYKVPQNVEAEDKILGPFSFRQFVYLLIAAASGFLVWLFGSILWPLALIPLPIMIFMLALALPLRKDQPMETYLLAIARFFFLPKKRIWSSGDTGVTVTIDASTNDGQPALKDIRGQEASNRLSFLAQVLDTGGWYTLGEQAAPTSVNSNINEDVAQEAVREADKKDLFEDNNQVNQSISLKLSGNQSQAAIPPVEPANDYDRMESNYIFR